ncbi:NADH-quinone oxidoreductase subunit L [Dietzia psychralcaliphila]|uniref:NADH-quinone oxidoreductase subunit L n=1 Tax=Dietzia psychralcaliphila TaxID=139021 RepID=A0AAD0JND5_9ACTN|nr:NADH-quinone oxidoreductase subunit L [Dietzia psychralcaliphila]AWH94458.1 NADH-quinone oxidoreductase subunit L [Dietzia psychralcaliphila]PTM88106.1 NADH dehydrogenase subunit L [Dietzia psychralcaliphila]
MTPDVTLWLIPGLPLLGAALLLILGRRSDPWGHLLGCATAVAAFCVAAWQFAAMAGREASDRTLQQTLFTWISVGELHVDLGLRLDQLSMVFVLLVTGVGLLIHVYSTGYMAADPARRKFFAYLNLFLAAMLLLVMADDFLVLYLGWEGVGLVSYLLIGFWQHKPSAATAAKKAFLVNRVGDIGLAVALMVMVTQLGTLSFDGVFAALSGADDGAAPGVSTGLVTALGLLLLLGACAKSAQVPLQSWLGDAMEGPTPVSALIHAATMVTAGVYLITRANPIFDAAPAARTAVIAVGAVTLLFGAVIGCAKDDIKKVLAASTMSQVGYMVMAAGFGPAGYALAIMHLLTHGFFKAGLFLGAGSVMHGMDDEVDMRRYGALRAVMPVTFVTFGLGYLAIIGVPPFSGFYSKEGIISAAFDVGGGGAAGYLLGAVALLGTGLTAFYMTRVMILTFFGRRRWHEGAHPHESPVSMTAPMFLVAVGSVVSGAFLAIGGRLQDWLAPVVGDHSAEHVVPVWLVTTASLIVVTAGIAVAVRQYGRAAIPEQAPSEVSALTRAARRDLYADAVNEGALMRPGQALVAGTAVVDRRVVGGATGGVAATIGFLSARGRLLQSGLTRSYALYMLIGAALIIAAMAAGGVL